MERVNIKEINLKFLNPMTDRFSTDMIVIHHTGNENCVDADPSAEEINRWHKNQGYAGIGYHFVIRKNGTIERGRPVWALGAHAYGENWHSIGIHFSGTFNGSEFSSLSELEKISEILVYFAYPYSSWEKGTVENLNGLFRRIYFKSSFLANSLTRKIL